MKLNSLILSTLLIGVSSHADISIFNYTVFAKNSIRAGCSDFQGRTAALGPIFLHDFQVVKNDNKIGCAVESNSSVSWNRGSTMDLVGNVSCVAAPVTNLVAVNSNERRAVVAPFGTAEVQIDDLSGYLAADYQDEHIRRVNFKIDNQAGGVITVTGSANELLVLNVASPIVRIVQKNLILKGGVSARNLIWNFPSASEVVIDRSGNAALGMVGTFIAPNADVTFVNSRITGALFAKNVYGETNGASCAYATQKAGQVNAVCIDGMIAGIGCGCAGYHVPVPPTPAPTPVPTPTPHPMPNPCPQPQPGQQQQWPTPPQQPRPQQQGSPQQQW